MAEDLEQHLDALVACYRDGVFPMADSADDPNLFLVEPKWRGVIPLDGLHISRRLARTLRSNRLSVTFDQDFDGVVSACADRPQTWINQPIRTLYRGLFERDQAHSVEVWREGELAGGLYGVSLGGAFFGESMFSRQRDASKVALAALVERLKAGGYGLLDAQFMTDHLRSLGAEEISQHEYRRRLAAALALEGRWAT